MMTTVSGIASVPWERVAQVRTLGCPEVSGLLPETPSPAETAITTGAAVCWGTQHMPGPHPPTYLISTPAPHCPERRSHCPKSPVSKWQERTF